jgi:OTU domain-containing protein 6
MPPKTKAYYDRQKAKDKKKKQKEMATISAEHEAAGDPGLKRAMELSAVDAELSTLGLVMSDVAADGNCLFSAIMQQLKLAEVAGQPSADELRALAGQYMLDNAADFSAFVDGDGGLEAHVRTLVASSETWGGDLEIQALARALKVRVRVVKALAPFPQFGSEGPELTIVHLEHFMVLGAHYTGTKPKPR